MITIIPELSGLIQLNQMLVEREGCVDRTFRWPRCCDCFSEISSLAVPAGIRDVGSRGTRAGSSPQALSCANCFGREAFSRTAAYAA